MTIRPVGAALFHADGRTDTNLIADFLNFANAPKNEPKGKEIPIQAWTGL